MEGTYVPAIRYHEDVATHLVVEYSRKRYPVPNVPAIPVEHHDGGAASRKLVIQADRVNTFISS